MQETAMEGVCIEAAHTASPDLVAEIAPLVRQLSTSAAPLELKELSEILASPTTTLLVARGGTGRVTGILTLVTFRIPTGLRAFIEDVVVDVSARREGIGEALTREAIAIARAKGARTIDLTSRPSREAANLLYQRLGFERRDTNVYRLPI
jgi:ribosomal protein S18 acetylase RimI-like enzyme